MQATKQYSLQGIAIRVVVVVTCYKRIKKLTFSHITKVCIFSEVFQQWFLHKFLNCVATLQRVVWNIFLWINKQWGLQTILAANYNIIIIALFVCHLLQCHWVVLHLSSSIFPTQCHPQSLSELQWHHCPLFTISESESVLLFHSCSTAPSLWK